MTDPIYNPGEPYMMTIPGGLSPGRIFHITGTMRGSSFVVKLQSGPYGDPNDDVGLCLYARHNEGLLGANAFIRSTGWGQEQPVPTQSFGPGQAFELAILCDPYQFKIALNNQHFLEFNHRTNPSTLTHANVSSSSADVSITCLWAEDPNRPPGQPMHQQQSIGPSYASAPLQGQGPYAAPPMMNQGGMPQYNMPTQQQQQYQQYQQQGSKPDKGFLGMLGGGAGGLAGQLMGRGPMNPKMF